MAQRPRRCPVVQHCESLIYLAAAQAVESEAVWAAFQIFCVFSLERKDDGDRRLAYSVHRSKESQLLKQLMV